MLVSTRLTWRVRRLVAALLALMLSTVASATAAWGDDPQGQQDQTRRRQEQVQADLDLAKASDTSVEAEVARLGQAVADEQAKVDDARQAEAAAQVAVSDGTRKLADIEARIQGFHQELARRAVTAYVNPAGPGGVMAMTQASSLDQAERRQALLDVVQSRTADLVEALRASREDEAVATRDLHAARRLATERATAEAAQLKQLQDAQGAQEAAHAELQRRISELQAESQELAAHEQALEDLIRTRAAAVAAAQAAHPQDAGIPPVAGVGTASASGFIWPVHGPVTSEFGPRWGGFHPGIDIAPPYGTPIVAARAGVVVFAGPNDGYGNFVVIDHGNGLATAYAHQSSITVGENQTVAQGQVIGFVGSTGFSTGPHLHFEVRVNGVPQNPRNFEAGSP